ncbi:DUF3298 and DUF4163 domain-containing protein [Pedobacter aquatilis]|uniref:DUF3298 and DUF4163 domain-containing protein n=1 Tax=Pedobacter aquatilis TaxID=351343 RepID=UPI00292CA6B6|nr:DUF3298 domain-containing protein [Pedobacter aquatilis]
MKNLIYLGFFCLLITAACNNPKYENDSATADSTKNIKTELTANFYKRLEGTIAGKPVVMHLQSVDNDYSGVYSYNGSWLNLSTDTLIGKDSVLLNENGFYDYYFDKDAKQSRLNLKWTGNGFNGTWKNDKENKTYPIALTEKYPEGSYQFEAGIYQDSIKAMVNEEKSPVAQISFEYLKPKSKDESSVWLDKQLKQIFNRQMTQTDRHIGFKKIASAYFEDYKTQIKDQQKNAKDRGFLQWMNYTNNSQQSIAYNDNDYVVIDFLADAYTGGAHGNYSSTMFCFDVKNKKQMVLSDVVKIDSNTLQKIVEQNLRKNYNIKPSEQLSSVLFDNFIKPNKNFYFNANGLAFMYNPYEVASYAQGQIVVFIPYSDLKAYLVPAFADRMKIK